MQRALLAAIEDRDHERFKRLTLCVGADFPTYTIGTNDKKCLWKAAATANDAAIMRTMLEHRPLDNRECLVLLSAVVRHKRGGVDMAGSSVLDVTEMVALLLEHVKNPQADDFGVVNGAVVTGRLGVLEMLLAAGFRVPADALIEVGGYIVTTRHKYNMVDWPTVSRRARDMAQVLMDHGVDANCPSDDGGTALSRLTWYRSHCRNNSNWNTESLGSGYVQALDDYGTMLVARGAPVCRHFKDTLLEKKTVGELYCAKYGLRPDSEHVGCKHGPLPSWMRERFLWSPDRHRYVRRKLQTKIRTTMALWRLQTPLAVLPIELVFVVFELLCTE